MMGAMGRLVSMIARRVWRRGLMRVWRCRRRVSMGVRRMGIVLWGLIMVREGVGDVLGVLEGRSVVWVIWIVE